MTVAATIDAGATSVTFTDLGYSAKTKKALIPIISGLSGEFQPGKLTALMGPSGSGKTTLMDILAGRKSGAGVITGQVLYGGAAVGGSVLQNLCGYVEQFDTLVNELTVEQMLQYTAELKLPKSMSRKDKEQRCNEVIEILRLEKCRATVIGNPLRRGISGGQAKRVNIALALITRPRVIYLDEPTSGLDSRMANEVCSIMKNLAKEGRTVVATIHSPTSFAFSLFDRLLMLQAGGRPIYNDSVGDIVPYFESLGQKFPEGGYSLPDWLVDVTSQGAEDEGKAQVDFAALWVASDKCSACEKAHKDLVGKLKASPVDLTLCQLKGPGQFHALRTLLRFRMLAHYRDGEFLGPRIGDKIFMAVLILSLYWGIGDETDPQSIQSVTMVLYFMAALCGYGAAAYVPSLTLERALFYRERNDGCYFAVTYYASKFIEEAVLCTVTSFLFGLIVFFSMQLQGSFILFVAAYYLTAMVGICLAYTVAAVAPNMEAANALLPTYVTTCMYFGGVFLLFDKIPVWWGWYSYTSFLRYSFGTLMINQFKDTETGSKQMFWDEETQAYTDILHFYGLSDGLMGNIGACYGILVGIMFFVAFLGVMALTYMSHIKR